MRRVEAGKRLIIYLKANESFLQRIFYKVLKSESSESLEYYFWRRYNFWIDQLSPKRTYGFLFHPPKNFIEDTFGTTVIAH